MLTDTASARRISRPFVATAIVVAATLAVYLPVLSSLVRQWASDENYSHGFLILPFAVFFGWQQRDALAREPIRPSLAAGIAVVAGSLLVFAAGILGAELFLTRVSLVGLVAGAILVLWGPAHLRRLAFPVAFLLLMIPWPAIVFNQVAFPLQVFASKAGETILTGAGVPVLREGNVLVLPSTTLEVAQACSGIRSLISLLAISLILGRLNERRQWARIALAILTIPVAIAANAARVAGTGLAAQFIGPEAAQGFFHEFSGWVVFVLALALLMAAQRGLAAIHRAPVLPRGVVAGLS